MLPMLMLLRAIADVDATYCGGGATRVVAGVVDGAGVDGSVTILARMLRQYHDFC